MVLYALFEQINGRWFRIMGCAYSKANALRVYAPQLAALTAHGRIGAIRRVTDNGGI